MRNPRARRRLARAALAAASVGLVTAACGPAAAKLVLKSSAQPSSPPASPAPVPTPSPTAPLTGLAVSAVVAGRPAVALAVTGGHPAGLSAADVVFEEISRPVRYVALFQSHESGDVGPVGGTLPTDGQLLSVLHPLTGYLSGTPSFLKVLHRSAVIDLGYPTHASLYSAGGSSASTRVLERAARAPAPPPLFSYRGVGSGMSALARTGQSRPVSVIVSFPPGVTQKWAFDQRRDCWTDAVGGPGACAANLVVQTVHYKTVFLSRKLHQTTTAPKVLGRSGAVTVFSGIAGTSERGPGGLAASGQWSKPGLRDVTEYTDKQGFPMAFQPGPTWVILAPYGTRLTTTQAQS
jgi:hypothetical protein